MGTSGLPFGIERALLRLDGKYPYLSLHFVTEAYNDAGEEFGEKLLIERLRQHRELSCQAALTAIADEV